MPTYDSNFPHQVEEYRFLKKDSAKRYGLFLEGNPARPSKIVQSGLTIINHSSKDPLKHPPKAWVISKKRILFSNMLKPVLVLVEAWPDIKSRGIPHDDGL